MSTPRKTTQRAIAFAAAAAIAMAMLAGCKSPARYHKEADKAATDIVAQKQMEALGRTEPFTIERPEDTLRKRLIEAQALPAAGPESMGTSHVPTPAGWPEKPAKTTTDGGPGEGELASPAGPVKFSLFEALEVAASNSREYQSQKETLFRAALDLDLQRNDFRSIFSDSADAAFTTNHSQGGPDNSLEVSNSVRWSKLLESGASITAGLALDLATLLTGNHTSSLGIRADTSISVPLLRGAGKRIVTEPLTQGERNVVYAVHNFQDYRRDFAVRVAGQYLDVLRGLDSVKNAEENYRSLVSSGRRARRLADAGRLPDIQVDQARQDELRARSRWITAMENQRRSLDNFKLTLGLPTDALIELDPQELNRLAEAARNTISAEDATKAAAAEDAVGQEPAEGAASEALAADAPVELVGPTREGAGPYEIDESLAIDLAMENRLDLRTAIGRFYDAQRKVIVAADALRAGLEVQAGGSFGEGRSAGSADRPDADLRPERGVYDAVLIADLPWERTGQRNSYRRSIIDFERAARDLQQAEDQVKLEVRNDLRTLLTARESIKIQIVAVNVARRRVNSVELFLQAGRAEIRDLLDAQEALVSAQDALTTNLVDYRVATLALQRDMGLLETDEKGLWREYDPRKFEQAQ